MPQAAEAYRGRIPHVLETFGTRSNWPCIADPTAAINFRGADLWTRPRVPGNVFAASYQSQWGNLCICKFAISCPLEKLRNRRGRGTQRQNFRSNDKDAKDMCIGGPIGSNPKKVPGIRCLGVHQALQRLKPADSILAPLVHKPRPDLTVSGLPHDALHLAEKLRKWQGVGTLPQPLYSPANQVLVLLRPLPGVAS
jgi:hypothetical protein